MQQDTQHINQVLSLDIVTPDKLVLSKNVEMVIVPGSEGEFGVLLGHVELLSLITQGIVKIFQNGKVTEQVYIDQGFAEVTNDKVVILVQDAIVLNSNSKKELNDEIKRLQSLISKKENSVEVDEKVYSIHQKIKVIEQILDFIKD